MISEKNRIQIENLNSLIREFSLNHRVMSSSQKQNKKFENELPRGRAVEVSPSCYLKTSVVDLNIFFHIVFSLDSVGTFLSPPH